MDVLTNLGGYFGQFDKPLNVSVVSKLSKWQNLQSLSHDAMLNNLAQNFYGTKDAKVQFAAHTAANSVQLGASFAAIKPLILANGETSKLLKNDPTVGPVGPAVSNIGNLGAVFSVPATALSGGTKSVAALLN